MRDILKAYNADEPRDDRGRWTGDSGSADASRPTSDFKAVGGLTTEGREWQWARGVPTGDGGKWTYNIKHAGDPLRYIVRAVFSTSKGLTGAGKDLGRFVTVGEAQAAVDHHLAASDVRKYDADESRDSRGRWTSGGDGGASERDHNAFQRATLRPRDGDEVRKPAREILNQSLAYMHDKAAQLAGKVRQVIASTKFAGASPLPSGGVELRAHHTMPNGQMIQSHLQLNPWAFKANGTTGKVLTILHHGLVQSGVPYATPKNPIGVAFTDRRRRRA